MKILDIIEMKMKYDMEKPTDTMDGFLPWISPKSLSHIEFKNNLYIGLSVTPNRSWITIWDTDPKTITYDYRTDKISENMIGAAEYQYINNKVSRVVGPILKPQYRGKGLGVLFYEYALDKLYVTALISHKEHTPGSALIWSKLARKYRVMAVKNNGKEIPVIVDGMRLFIGDMPIYNIDSIKQLKCYRL